MFFTQEDYLKIEKWLKARAVKDSQFPELTDYDQPNPDDYFVILQGNKTNAKVKVTKAFLHIYNGLQNRPILRGSGNYSLITDSKWTTRSNEASGEGSIAIGLGNNKASKYLSVAIGQNNIVDSQFSWGLGSDNSIQSIDGYNKIFGNNNTINKGSRNYIIGDNNNLQYSSYNYVFGLNNHISGSNSSAVIIGSNNNGSDGGSSIYIGKGLEGTANDGIASINLGQYNINVPGNRYLFTIGNGKDGNRSNALSIEYNGDINIQNIGSKTLQAYLKDLETSKQNKLIAGAGIAISSDNTISCILDTTIFVVVDTLPLVPEDTNINKIHLVKDTTVSSNLYSEYLYVNNTWDKLGDFQPSVDLSEYAKTADIPIAKGTGINSIFQKGSNKASGTFSSAFGNDTNASGLYTHAEGLQTEAKGIASHAEGHKTITENRAEHAEGTFNLPIKDKTIHTVGIGTSDTDRKNAHEIHLDGKHYIYGIGGYDGTNSQTEGVKTVQEVVEEFENKLDNCVDLTSEQTITGVKKFESTTSVKRLSLRTEGSSDDSRDSEIYVLAPQSGDLWNRMIIGGNKWAARLFIEGMSSQNYIPISDTEAVTAGYLKNFAKLDEGRTFTAAQTFGGGIDMNGTRVIKVAEPTDSTDAVNKNYVDTQVKTVDNKAVALDSRITQLEAKNTELTNTITTLETKIAELENIISQITIKEE